MDKTFLTVKELATKLGVSEKTVYRMTTSRSIPFAIKIGGQWRFNAEKIDKWVSEAHSVDPGGRKTDTAIRVADALNNGLIIFRTHGENRDEILDEVLGMVGTLTGDERVSIKRQILYRESIISSSLQGVAIMLPAIDTSYSIDKTMLLLAYLENPMKLGAIDGIATEAVVLLLAANKTERQIVKTRLARLFMERDFVALIRQQLNRRDLIDRVIAMETEIMG